MGSLHPFIHTSHHLLGGKKTCWEISIINKVDHDSSVCPLSSLLCSLLLRCRYADIIVHRLLAVAIAADTTYPDLMDKHKQSALSNNLNYRHKMAQYAQRASVAFHTQVSSHTCVVLRINVISICNHINHHWKFILVQKCSPSSCSSRAEAYRMKRDLFCL